MPHSIFSYSTSNKIGSADALSRRNQDQRDPPEDEDEADDYLTPNYIRFKPVIKAPTKIPLSQQKVIDKPEQWLEILNKYTTKLDIVDNKRPMIKCTGDINGKKCTMMSSNVSNHAKNVSANLEFDKRNLYIQLGTLIYVEK